MKKPEISPEQCAARLSLPDGVAVLKEAASLASTQLGVSEEEIFEALKHRESLGSTGMAHGIALPHCALPEVSAFSIGVITLKNAVQFDALDGRPSDIFVYVVGPERNRTEHVRILASLTARLREQSVRDQVRSASNAGDLAGLFGSQVLPEKPTSTTPFSLMIINIQNDDLYEPILETVSGETGASVSVSSSQSAGSILNRMPLFATFWGDHETREVRRIEVVLPRDRINRTIRRVEELTGENPGVQIGAIDLSYCSGSLDL